MGLGRTQKQEFKMTPTYTTKKRERLMQVELKWCDELSRVWCGQIQTKHCNYYPTPNSWPKIGNRRGQSPLELYSLFSHKNDHEK
jgi:hypothetical protein